MSKENKQLEVIINQIEQLDEKKLQLLKKISTLNVTFDEGNYPLKGKCDSIKDGMLYLRNDRESHATRDEDLYDFKYAVPILSTKLSFDEVYEICQAIVKCSKDNEKVL